MTGAPAGGVVVGVIGFAIGMLICTIGELALLEVAVGVIGMLARVVFVTPHGFEAAEGAAEPARGTAFADGPVTSLDPQPAAAQRATMKALERTTVIFNLSE